MKQIHPHHLAFVDEAARAFEENPRWETYMNAESNLIALRFGMDRDCIKLYELGEPVGFFAQQMDIRIPSLRKEVARFAYAMEEQLRANEHKGGWENSTHQSLMNELSRNYTKLHRCCSHEEYRRRCANIANYAMMLADIDRIVEKEASELFPDES